MELSLVGQLLFVYALIREIIGYIGTDLDFFLYL